MQTSKSEATKPERVRDWDSEKRRDGEKERRRVREKSRRRDREKERQREGETRDRESESRRESRRREREMRLRFPQMLKTLGFWRLLEAQVQMGKPNNFGFNWFLSNWTSLFFGQKWSVQLDMDMVYSWTLGPFDISNYEESTRPMISIVTNLLALYLNPWKSNP